MVLSINFLAAQTTAPTQPTKAWTWATYGIGFQAPSDFVVRESSSTVFQAGNGQVFLTIYPKKGENLTPDKLKPALKKWAADNKVNFTSGDSAYILPLNRLSACYMNGNDSKGVSVDVLLLKDPSHPDNSYYVWLQYRPGYQNAAMDILKSFNIQ